MGTGGREFNESPFFFAKEKRSFSPKKETVLSFGLKDFSFFLRKKRVSGNLAEGFMGDIIEEASEDKKCSECNALASYSMKFDAFLCKKCNKWLEKQCGDSKCEFCSQRPAKPLTK